MKEASIKLLFALDDLVKNNLEEFQTENLRVRSTQDLDNLDTDEEDTHLGNIPDSLSQSSYNEQNHEFKFCGNVFAKRYNLTRHMAYNCDRAKAIAEEQNKPQNTTATI